MEQKSIGHFFAKIMYEIYNPYLNKHVSLQPLQPC